MTPLMELVVTGTLMWPQHPDTEKADVVFFTVALDPEKPTTRAEFERAVREHEGVFDNIDPLDGDEHYYIDLGRWLGDQRAALRCMGMGALLGSWELQTPYTMLGYKREIPAERAFALEMAGTGHISIQASKGGS